MSEITVQEVQSFISGAEKYKHDWEECAKRSWQEIKKRDQNNRLWAMGPNNVYKKQRYPAWYSIFKIRQNLIFSRIGIPIGRDTTQDGQDNVGATAAICKERLAINLAKSFRMLDVMRAVRDDGLATNFAACRAYYDRKEVKQKVKEYLTVEKQAPDEYDPFGETEVKFIDSKGNAVFSDDIRQDDEGNFFIDTEEVVGITEEKVCLKHILYKNFLLDPGVVFWEDAKRIAFIDTYSPVDFKRIFGVEAYNDLPKPDANIGDESQPKTQDIQVYEYWDMYEKDVRWIAKEGNDFIKPKGYFDSNDEKYEEVYEGEELNGLYNLRGFFPVPPPLLWNNPTDCFWPVPEYYQFFEIFEDIHSIFTRMVSSTKAIRTRLLFDKNVEGLKEALNEASNADAFGVPNLSQSLAAAGGSLESVAQYVPVEKMMIGLEKQMNQLDQRLATIYRLTGTSDLLQGLTQNNSDKTLGERRIEEKYANNQLNEPRQKMAEFVRDSYELLTEMAIKNFSDESLATYIMPQTLPADHKERYGMAIELLKDEFDRFRIDLQTDSTIDINEDYDRKMRVEFVNILTKALEVTANVAEKSPALAIVDLHAMKYLIQSFPQAKLFQPEVTAAIDNVIKSAENAAKTQPPPFNKDETMAKIKIQEIQSNNQLRMTELLSRERLEMAKLQQQGQIAAIRAQIETFEAKMKQGVDSAKLNVEYQKLVAMISEAQGKLSNEKSALLIELRKVNDKKEADRIALMIEERTKPYEMALAQQQQVLDSYDLKLRETDQMIRATDMQAQQLNTQIDNTRQQVRLLMDIKDQEHEHSKPPDLSGAQFHVHAAPTAKRKKRTKHVYDSEGNILESITSEIDESEDEEKK